MANSLGTQDYPEGSAAYMKDVFDPEFRERMQTDPGAAISSWGVDLPPGIDVRVHVNTDDVFHFIPAARSERRPVGRNARHGRRRQVGEHGRVRRLRQQRGYRLHHGQQRGQRRLRGQRGHPRGLTPEPGTLKPGKDPSPWNP